MPIPLPVWVIEPENSLSQVFVELLVTEGFDVQVRDSLADVACEIMHGHLGTVVIDLDELGYRRVTNLESPLVELSNRVPVVVLRDSMVSAELGNCKVVARDVGGLLWALREPGDNTYTALE